MKVAIYTTFNEGFLETGGTMIYSFLQTNPWFNGDIIVLCDEGDNCLFSEENRKKLMKISEKIKFLEVNSSDYQDIFNNFPQCFEKHFKSSFYKLEMFKKDEYDSKMYIDADAVFNGDVHGLFNISTIDAKFLLARDCISRNATCKEVTRKTQSDYANLGFLVVNGRMLTDYDYENVFNFCKSVKSKDFKNESSAKGRYGDQDCLNEYLSDSFLVQSHIYDANLTLYNKDETKIIHYYGAGRKPWDCRTNHEAFAQFYRNYFFANKIING